MINIGELKLSLGDDRPPQQKWEIDTALDLVSVGLTKLRSLGFTYDLVEGERSIPVEFPKMYFHPTHGHMIVHSDEVARNLSPGWQDKPIGHEGAKGIEWVEPGKDETTASSPVPVDIAKAFAEGKIAEDETETPIFTYP